MKIFLNKIQNNVIVQVLIIAMDMDNVKIANAFANLDGQIMIAQ
jgi:hypothetical protein